MHMDLTQRKTQDSEFKGTFNDSMFIANRGKINHEPHRTEKKVCTVPETMIKWKRNYFVGVEEDIPSPHI